VVFSTARLRVVTVGVCFLAVGMDGRGPECADPGPRSRDEMETICAALRYDYKTTAMIVLQLQLWHCNDYKANVHGQTYMLIDCNTIPVNDPLILLLSGSLEFPSERET